MKKYIFFVLTFVLISCSVAFANGLTLSDVLTELELNDFFDFEYVAVVAKDGKVMNIAFCNSPIIRSTVGGTIYLKTSNNDNNIYHIDVSSDYEISDDRIVVPSYAGGASGSVRVYDDYWGTNRGDVVWSNYDLLNTIVSLDGVKSALQNKNYFGYDYCALIEKNDEITCIVLASSELVRHGNNNDITLKTVDGSNLSYIWLMNGYLIEENFIESNNELGIISDFWSYNRGNIVWSNHDVLDNSGGVFFSQPMTETEKALKTLPTLVGGKALTVLRTCLTIFGLLLGVGLAKRLIYWFLR